MTTRHERTRLIERARDLYGHDDLEIDDNAELSPTDNGCWVAAWVYLIEEPAE